MWQNGNDGKGGYQGSKVQHKEADGIYIPLSIKAGMQWWCFFGTLEYQVDETIAYQTVRVSVVLNLFAEGRP